MEKGVRALVDPDDNTPLHRSINYERRFTALQQLKSEHGIEPSTVAKAAIALFNTKQTGTSRAVFKSTDASRSWPFVPKATAELLPNPFGISGPVYEHTINII